MRTGAVARVATDGYQVASLDRKARRRENHRQRVLARALEQLLVAVGKALQVTVDAGLSVGVADVDGVAEAVHANGEPADVAVGNGVDELALLILGLDVQSAVEMKRARLAKVASQHHFVVDGRMISYWLLAVIL